MSAEDRLLRKAIEGKKETRFVDFKSAFDPTHTGECCEIIKDIVAMANSGGGVIVVGVTDKGSPSGSDLAPVRGLDNAHFGNLLHKYTESNFADVEIHEIARDQDMVVAIRVGPSETPLVFAQAGAYADLTKPGKQKTAFGKGTVFFRHGSKSEPGTTEDIHAFLDRLVDAARRDLMKNVQKAAAAPPGSTIHVSPKLSGDVSADGLAVRLTTDPGVPVVGVLDYDKTHPYRQKDLVAAVQKLLPKGAPFGAYDVQAIRIVNSVPDGGPFCHRFAFGGRQYSNSFAVWIVERWEDDHDFFTKTRAAYLEYTKSMGRGPWTTKKVP